MNIKYIIVLTTLIFVFLNTVQSVFAQDSVTPEKLISKNNIILVGINKTEHQLCEDWMNSITYFYKYKTLAESPFDFLICRSEIRKANSSILGESNIAKLNTEYKSYFSIGILEPNKLEDSTIDNLITELKTTTIYSPNIITRALHSIKVGNNYDLIINNDGVDNSIIQLSDKLKTNINNEKSIKDIQIIDGSYESEVNDNIHRIRITIQNNSNKVYFIDPDSSNGIFATTNDPFDSQSKFYAGDSYFISPSRAKLQCEMFSLNQGEKSNCFIHIRWNDRNNIISKLILTDRFGKLFENTEISINLSEKSIDYNKGNSIFNYPLYVQVLKTPTGFLNARAGNSLNAKILFKVYPNEKYELVKKSGNWYKVKVKDTEVWLSSKYLKILY